MNKTVQSILSLTSFSLLLIIITLFCGGLGFARLLEIQGGMEYGFLAILMALDLMILYKVYKLYFIQPETILLLFGLEGCSVLLWFVFIGLDQNLSDWQITNHLPKAAGLDGSEGDERGWNMLAVLCGIVYPPIGVTCLYTGMRFLNKSVTTKADT